MSRKVVLSVAAHGDDAEFMAGGTLAKLAAEGHAVYLCVATDNERGSLRLSAPDLLQRARPEIAAAGQALGAKGVFPLGFSDGMLCDAKPSNLRGAVMKVIRQVKADIIFSWDPFAPFEDHPDHRVLALATSDAATFAHFPLYHPEQLSQKITPHRVSEWYWYSKARWQTNQLMDISGFMDQKLAALYAYDCQMVLTVDDFLGEARAAGLDEDKLAGIDPLDYRPWIDRAIRARAAKLGEEVGVKYAEAFRYQKLEAPEL